MTAGSARNEVVDPELQRIVTEWCREEEIRLCLLFGSRATGRAHAGSDVDLAVWPAVPGSVPDARTRIDWIGELTLRIEPEVNLVVVTPELDPVLGMEIARHGRVLYESEENLWAWERLRLWHLFNDALPFLKRQREDLRRYAEEVGRGA
jgi:predicted nucleotidyltransferase